MEPDMVIVTIETLTGKTLGDFELPARMPVSQLSGLLLEALSDRLPFWKGIRIIKDGRELEGGDTLLSRGVWDGSYVTVGPD